MGSLNGLLVLIFEKMSFEGKISLPKALSVAGILKCVSLMNKVLN